MSVGVQHTKEQYHQYLYLHRPTYSLSFIKPTICSNNITYFITWFKNYNHVTVLCVCTLPGWVVYPCRFLRPIWIKPLVTLSS